MVDWFEYNYWNTVHCPMLNSDNKVSKHMVDPCLKIDSNCHKMKNESKINSTWTSFDRANVSNRRINKIVLSVDRSVEKCKSGSWTCTWKRDRWTLHQWFQLVTQFYRRFDSKRSKAMTEQNFDQWLTSEINQSESLSVWLVFFSIVNYMLMIWTLRVKLDVSTETDQQRSILTEQTRFFLLFFISLD